MPTSKRSLPRTYTGQRSEMDTLGLMFYRARFYDPSLGRFAQADSIVPGGVQGLDRYAYVNNNALRYNDPTGHLGKDNTILPDGGGANPKPKHKPTIELTSVDLEVDGHEIQNLYNLFLNTPGFWSLMIADGCDPFTLFLAIMLSKESFTLWIEAEASEWGAGGKNDSKTWFSQAANHWLWGWVENSYGVAFGSLSPQSMMNAVFNLLARMESVEGIYYASKGLLLTDKGKLVRDSQYSGWPSDGDRLRKVLNPLEFNANLYGVAQYALSNPTTGYWTWGNAPSVQEIPSDALYRYDNFYILGRYAR
jgi:RHS repeat-associated protein